MEIERRGSCVVLHMKCGQNVMTPEFLQAFSEALDEAETYEDAKSLVTTGEGKYYCTGFDVQVVGSSRFVEMADALQKLLARLLTFPLVTVAAINGHGYGGGALLALVHDYQLMRSDRGWLCVPIVRLGNSLRLPAALVEVIRTQIPVPEYHQTLILGKRYTAEEAKTAGIVNEVSSLEELKDSAIAAANRLAGDGLDRKTLATLKHDLHRDVYQALKEPVRFYSHL